MGFTSNLIFVVCILAISIQIIVDENFVPTYADSEDFVSTGTFSSITIGTDGFPVISYWDQAYEDLKMLHCTSLACKTHDPPIILDSDGSVGRFNSLAIGNDGFPIISYHDRTNGVLKLVHCTNLSCTSNETPVILDSIGTEGGHSSITIGIDGFPIVSYLDHENGDLKIIHCTNISCTKKDKPVLLDSEGSVGFYPSVEIGVDGFPIISYFKFSTNEIRIVHCTNVSCTTYDNPQTFGTKNTVIDMSMTLGTNGFPVISYRAEYEVNIKVIQCKDQTCTTFYPSVILDNSDYVARHSSIKIGSDGFLISTYYDGSNKDLRLVHCRDTFCNQIDQPIILDSEGNVGQFTSLAIGNDGFPVISYYDETNGDLKMIHCTNSDCSNSDLPVTLDRGVPYEPDIWNLNKDFIFFVINIMGDVGIFMQMIGFSIFLIIPIKETFNIQLEATKESRLSSFLERKSVRIFGILLILIGLSFQFDFLKDLAYQSFSHN